MYLLWALAYYMTLNIILLVPLAISLAIIRAPFEGFLGKNEIIDNIFMVLAFSALIFELWLVHRSAYIKSSENRGFFQALGDAVLEVKNSISLMLGRN
ncbi:MAG: hypothetical protein V4688_02215 [Pseudomonadota bacterium]